jgi:hypothetical protein
MRVAQLSYSCGFGQDGALLPSPDDRLCTLVSVPAAHLQSAVLPLRPEGPFCVNIQGLALPAYITDWQLHKHQSPQGAAG